VKVIIPTLEEIKYIDAIVKNNKFLFLKNFCPLFVIMTRKVILFFE